MDTDALEQRVAALEQMVSQMQYGASFLRFGADISKPDKTAIVVCLADDDYNGEALVEGDVLIGDNTDGSVNLLFNSSGVAVRNGTATMSSLTINGIQTALGFGHTTINYPDSLSGNVDLDLYSSHMQIGAATADFTIRDIESGWFDGMRLIIENQTQYQMTLKNAFAASAPYADIKTFTGADETTAADPNGNGIAELIYETSGDVWKLLSIRG